MKNSGKTNMSQREIEGQIRNVDKAAVESKLREMGMGDIADKLNHTDSEEIIRMLRANPEVLIKVNQMMGGK